LLGQGGAPDGGPKGALGGIYHASGAGEATWHEFAQAIFAAAGAHGWPVPTITPIATADWPTPARRPADSRLDCSKLEAAFGAHLPPWQPSLVRAVSAICAAELAA
jgi:dTDP-4-dehydrorhamnose reductase